MKKMALIPVGLSILALLLSATVLPAAPQGSNLVGTWQMTVQAGDHGGRGRGGGGAQVLAITQDEGKFKVSHKTPRGENTYDAIVSGDSISWTEVHQRRNGGTMNVAFNATLDGDTLKGTMTTDQFSRQFTATKSN